MTYVIDYGDRPHTAVGQDEDFVQRVAQAPPHLLHLGHDTPLMNHWGAACIRANGGTRLASLAELQARREAIRDFVRRLHETGVRYIVPYICNQTLGGDPETRTGIWAFYDHWDDYADFGVGPRPASDPVDWLTRDSRGRLHYNYETNYSYFENFGQRCFAPCMNNPDYKSYQALIVTKIAEVGYDGVFVDNCILNCYCPHCQRAFREYMAARYDAAELRSRFGFRRPEAVRLGVRGSALEYVLGAPAFRDFLRRTLSPEELTHWVRDPDPDKAPLEEGGNGWLWGQAFRFRREATDTHSPQQLDALGLAHLDTWGLRNRTDRNLWAETKRFWAHSVRDNLEYIRSLGARIRGSFAIVANWGAARDTEGFEYREEIGHDVRVWAPQAEFQMFEEDMNAGRVAPGLYLDHIFQHHLAQNSGTRGAVLAYGALGTPGVELGLAEAAAGGGLFVEHLGADSGPRRAYNRFFQEHANLYADTALWRQVGLTFFVSELGRENHAHVEQVWPLAHFLSAQHLLFGLLAEEEFSGDRRLWPPAVIVPHILRLEDSQVAALEEHVREGGVGVLVGPVGTEDRHGRRRPRRALPWPLLRHGTRLVAHGAGHWVLAASLEDLVPRRALARHQAVLLARGDLTGMLKQASAQAQIFAALEWAAPVERFLEPSLLLATLRRLRPEITPAADPYAAAGVGFTAYQQMRNQQAALIVHAVNYNVTITAPPNEQKREPVSDIALTIPLPERWTPAGVECLTVSGEPATLAWEFSAPVVRVTLPRLDGYAVLRVRANVE